MKVCRNSKFRMLIQETLKGLAKGLNLSSFVLKGLLFSGDNWQYFLLTLCARGIASASIKALSVTYILRIKALKLKKVQLNLLYHVFPSLMLFIGLKVYQHMLNDRGSIIDDLGLGIIQVTDDFESIDT